MAADPTTPPPADDGPDSVEAELVAYLDGELDPPDARRVEARLAADPALRKRADALERSYALLDFLPKPDPSPTFATRTLDKIPAAEPRAPVPVAPSAGTGSLALSGTPSVATARRGGWAWAVGLVLAVGAALGAGYLGTAAARTYLFPPPAAKEPTADNLPVADLRIIHTLPLYAATDDLDFVEKLAAPEFFGDEVAAADGPAPPQPADPDPPTGKAFDALVRAFRDLPPDRLEKIRALDQALYDLDPARRDRLVRVLEAYAAWLYRLPDADRKKVLAAATAGDRLEAVRDVRNGQWVAALPAARRQQLKALPIAEKAAMINQWRAEEDRRRDVWRTARAHWDVLRSGRQPWPFADEKLKAEVLEFVTAAYRPDDPRRNRLGTAPMGGDQARLAEALDRGAKAGEWVWLGKAVYDLSRMPRYEMLPEPGSGDPVTKVADLWPAARDHYIKPKPALRLDQVVGKWPDFALAIWDDSRKAKAIAIPSSCRLGPARPDEFKPDVRRFLPELRKQATPAEWDALAKLEGRWPDYPREIIRLAKAHDLGVPGATPPGPPSMWEKTYNPPRPAGK